MYLDLFVTLFNEHVLCKTREGKLLVLIFQLNFRPLMHLLDFFLAKSKITSLL